MNKVMWKFKWVKSEYIPVVEWSSALGELEVQKVDLLEHALGVVERVAAALRERAQAVPLRADALAARVHWRHVVVLQCAVKYWCAKLKPILSVCWRIKKT